MSRALITEAYLTDIANAIRTKLGVQDTYTPPQMAAAIESIPTGGITPTGTKNINQNGTHDVTQYASANVNVTPNLQSKTVTPSASQQTAQADSGYDGLSSVTVNGDTNLAAGNIKKDVEIFGVTGTYEGSGGGGGTLLMSQGQVSTDSAYATAYFASGVDVTLYDAIVVKMYENNAQVSQGAAYIKDSGISFYCYGDLQYTMSMNATSISCTNYRGSYRNLYVDVYGVNV